MKTLMVTTAFALAAGAALAQPSSPHQDTIPSAETSGIEAGTASQQEEMDQNTPTADELSNATITDDTGTPIGRVVDIEMEGESISAIIVDVGAFLESETRLVRMPLDVLLISEQTEGAPKNIITTMTSEEIGALPVQD
ncbi:PRC-barrel domain-containing protein [Ketogulonicigenium vulgare]|uniref:PRC-barrel domain-containing protein n=1 Tax=Ketogulonicigenium vulgare TaxID=92945 RepID=UPI0023589D3F|nr:PRC-barrel domain-containing protein [Ketogulonicigenium vulgare]